MHENRETHRRAVPTLPLRILPTRLVPSDAMFPSPNFPYKSPRAAVLRLPLLDREGLGRCIWSCRAAPAVLAGDRMAFIGEVPIVRLERRFRSRG